MRTTVAGQSPFRPTTRDEVLAMLLFVETELPALMEPWKAHLRGLDTVITPGGMSEDECKNRIALIKVAVTNLLQERGLAEDGFNQANCVSSASAFCSRKESAAAFLSVMPF